MLLGPFGHHPKLADNRDARSDPAAIDDNACGSPVSMSSPSKVADVCIRFGRVLSALQR